MAGGYQKVVMMDLSTSFGLKKNNKLLRIENSVEIVPNIRISNGYQMMPFLVTSFIFHFF